MMMVTLQNPRCKKVFRQHKYFVFATFPFFPRIRQYLALSLTFISHFRRHGGLCQHVCSQHSENR